LELNHAHQIYADNVNVLGGSIHTVNKNTEALALTSKGTGLKISMQDKITT
jgi:hypothetical protein